MYGQLSKALSLNEICDAARLHEPEWNRIRGATAPKRNTFSNANRTRDPAMAEALYWAMLEHLEALSPGFLGDRRLKGFLARLKRDVFAIDSTTLRLALNCIDWARHRRKKAAAKLHMKLDLRSRLPSFAAIGSAGKHDCTQHYSLCRDLCDGDVLLADRAYVDLPFLYDLSQRGVTFVLRDKENMVYNVVARRTHKNPRILSDEIVVMGHEGSYEKYPSRLRRVVALVEVDGKDQIMSFITHNFDWSPRTIVELYRARWAIETFFKELKQTLQLTDFVGYNENAVKWQVWTALLTHLLIRFQRHVSRWGLSFSRLVGVIRSAIWIKKDLPGVLQLYGTASGPKQPRMVEVQLCFKGFGAAPGISMG